MDIERLFTGVMALDRAALPALASQAALRTHGMQSFDMRTREQAAMAAGASLPVRRENRKAIVPLVGLIASNPLLVWLFGGTHPDAFVRALREAVEDPDVREIVLLVDSPGGEVSLVTETAAEVRRLRNLKPITAIARTQMASAALWIAAQATTVVGTASADVGSVGVFSVHTDSSRALDQAGVTVTFITSDPEKVEGNPAEPLGDDARAHVQRRVNAVHAQFVADLAAGRGVTTAQVRAQYGHGRSFGAAEALKRGLLDRVMTLEALLTSSSSVRTRSLAALSEADQALADEMAILVALSGDR